VHCNEKDLNVILPNSYQYNIWDSSSKPSLHATRCDSYLPPYT